MKLSSKEIFKQIKGFEGLYEVSNLGRVRSLSRWVSTGKGRGRTTKTKVLKCNKDSYGYYNVILYNKGKGVCKKIHQLVAIAFLNHTPDGHKIVIDHKDNDKSNNRVSNLQLVSQRYNATKDRHNSCGFTGVSFFRGSYKSQIQIDGIMVYLGSFGTAEDAGKAYTKKLMEININLN